MADFTCSLDRASPWNTPGVRARPWIAWFVPDLALLTSIITLFVCLFLFDGTRTLFRDSDAGWHIRTGEAILSGALPHTDTYSLTRTGSPWVAWEWGSDVLMGAAHRVGGLAAVAGLYGFAIAACTWMWFQLHWAAGGNFLLAGAMSTLLLSTGSIHWLARPHVFSWLLLIGFVLYLERKSGRRLWVVALLSVVWTNIHASFFLAPLIAFIYAASHVLRPLIWTLDRTEEWSKARWYAIAAITAAVATLANPYGVQVHAHVIQYLSDSELISRIGEFQSFNFHAEGGTQILLTVAAGGLGGVLALSQRKLAHFFLAVLWIAIALRSARALPVVGLLLLPLANGAISEALAKAQGLQPTVRRRIDRFLQYSANLRKIDASVGGWAIVPMVAVCVAGLLAAPPIANRAGFPPEQFPVAAAHHIGKLPHDTRLLAPDMYGGYIIYRFNGARKVFFDGRSDFYGSEYMKNYLRLIELRPGWQQQIGEFGFTHALLPNHYSLVPALQQLGWKKLYSDDVATLLEKYGS